MANKPDPFQGLKLTQPQERPLGTGSIEQRLFKPQQQKAPQADASSSQEDRKIGRQEDAEIQKEQNPKVGFRLSYEAIAALDEMRIKLMRKHGMRALKQDILEEAIMHLYHDFEENGERSVLFRQLSSHQDRKTGR